MKSFDSFLAEDTKITKLNLLTAATDVRGGEDGADDIFNLPKA